MTFRIYEMHTSRARYWVSRYSAALDTRVLYFVVVVVIIFKIVWNNLIH